MPKMPARSAKTISISPASGHRRYVDVTCFGDDQTLIIVDNGWSDKLFHIGGPTVEMLEVFKQVVATLEEAVR